MSDMRVRFYLVKLKLIEMGDYITAEGLEDQIQPSSGVFDEEKVEKTSIINFKYLQQN